jgi:DNA primase
VKEAEKRYSKERYGEDSHRVTKQQIDDAMETKIENIIKVNHAKKAICVNHEEKTPSMDCRNNFAYCYGCGYKANVIQLYMQIHKMGFKKAVELLSVNRGV